MNVAIVGAGILGRITAFAAYLQKWNVTLYDENPVESRKSTSFVAAGLLTPIAELEYCHSDIFLMGMESLQLWPLILKKIQSSFTWAQSGSLWLAHEKDRAEFNHVLTKLSHRLQEHHCSSEHELKSLSYSELLSLEPELGLSKMNALFLKSESFVNCHSIMKDLLNFLIKNHVKIQMSTKVQRLASHELWINNEKKYYDMIFDCRGLGAKEDLLNLRGVRGEIVCLHAPEVKLKRPIRLMHPRYPIYIVPYPNHRYRIGASQIESEDYSPISVQTLFELLSAAYSVHHGFLNARVEKTMVQCRPCFPSGIPEILAEEGLIRINGLYRHGYLVTPALISHVFKKHFSCENLWDVP